MLPDVCTLPKQTGPCTAYFERFYYDQNTGYCKMFVYGGCQGNKNRFVTEQECRNQCNAKPPVGELEHYRLAFDGDIMWTTE